MTFLDGKIDDFQFWNTALTQSEIQSYMYSPHQLVMKLDWLVIGTLMKAVEVQLQT